MIVYPLRRPTQKAKISVIVEYKSCIWNLSIKVFEILSIKVVFGKMKKRNDGKSRKRKIYENSPREFLCTYFFDRSEVHYWL